ncbi:MAG: magnesium transporter CorA family protein [Candidatus Pacebacteria bacterium]|jgi:magnesium transporter|nr:magnesium transporter CorA family protein [Candidatus Paceibacterota bacterium]
MKREIVKNKFTWIDIIDPTDQDTEYLKKTFDIHPLTANAIIPSFHYPDLDQFRNYLFIILHYPHTCDNGEIKIREFDIIAGKDYLVTSSREAIRPLANSFDTIAAAIDDSPAPDAPAALFFLLNAFLKEVLAKVNDLSQEIDRLESEIFTGRQRDLLHDISELKMKIIDYWRIVEPQRMIFDSLRATGANFFGAEHRHFFILLHQTHRRIENTLKNAKETIEALEETNHILITVKTNEVIRVLTVFSVIFMPLTLLASVWGMNTNFLPFHGTNDDFSYIMAIMAACLFAMLAFFRHKKWI